MNKKRQNDIIKEIIDEDKALMILGFLVIWKRRRKINKQTMKKNREVWFRDIYKQQEEKSAYHTLVQDLQRGNRERKIRK